MSLRRKVLLVVTLTMVGILALLYVLVISSFKGYLNQIESSDIKAQSEHIQAVINAHLADLQASALRWAATPAIQRAAQPDPDRADDTAVANQFTALGYPLAVIVDPDGAILYERANPNDADRSTLLERLRLDYLEKCRSGSPASAVCQNSGLLDLDGRLMEVVKVEIPTRAGRPAFLIVARDFNVAAQSILSSLADHPLRVYPNENNALPGDVKQASIQLSAQTPTTQYALDAHHLLGYTLLPDITGQESLIASVEINRTLQERAHTGINYLLITILVISLTFVVITQVIIDKLVTSRLNNLKGSLTSIISTGDLSERVVISGEDEIGALGRALNRMLETLQVTQQSARENEARYRAIVEDQTELICRIRTDGVLTFVNGAYCRYFNQDVETLIHQTYYPDVPEEDLQVVSQKFSRLSVNNPVITFEHRVILGNNEVRWLSWIERAIYNEQKELSEYQMVGRDITDKKRVEDALRYLSERDPLTGLYNRAYMEHELDRIAEERLFPTTIIQVDVDKLKSVNDQYGHHAGDELLISTANTLLVSFRPEDVVVRVGGDEFAVVLPSTDLQTAQTMIDGLHDTLLRHNAKEPAIPILLSLGAATAFNSEEINLARKDADQFMYQEKRTHQVTAA